METKNTISEGLKIIVDFQYKSISELVNTLSKGMTYYLIIMAALTGYIVTQTINPEITKAIILIGIITNFFALLSGIVLALGIYKGIRYMKNTLLKIDPDNFETLNLESFFKGGRRIALLVSIFCSLLLISISFYLFALMK
jgi:hypothetical protein